MNIEAVQPDAEMAFSRTGSLADANAIAPEEKTDTQQFDNAG